MEKSHIQQFYNDTNIFITGGTGFLGKVLIEKLLRSTNCSTIYIMIRPKKGKNIQDRLNHLLDDLIFDTLREQCPKFKYRVVAIEGDCSVAGLGLTQLKTQMLCTKINVVFNVAATVNFDENLKLAYGTNVNAVKEVLNLCKQMKELKSVIHISTAFSNCHLQRIEEEFYDCPSYEEVGYLLEKLSQDEAEIHTERIIGQWPNTYTFTKALAESLIRDQGKGLAIGIFRPAIVISTYKEPVPGWIDNLYGPTGVCAGTGSGLLRTLYCDKNKTADLIPVDTCVAGIIAAGWQVGAQNNGKSKIPIYNYVSSVENPITWHQFDSINKANGEIHPFANSMWKLCLILTTNYYYYQFLKVFLHIIPALIVDLGSFFIGHKQSVLGMYKKIHKFSDVLGYFCTREWSFSNKNVVNLWETMNNEDKKNFPLSMTTVHWLLYYKEYLVGIKKYIFKDKPEYIKEARRKQKIFGILHNCLKAFFYFTISISVFLVFLKMFSYSIC